MLDAWILRQPWTKPSKMVGLYLFQMADDSWFGELSILKKGRKSIAIDRNQWTTGPLEEVLSLVPQQSNVCITVDGKGVIINELQSEHETVALSQIIPGGKHDDFYISQQSVSAKKVIAAITRKEVPDQIIERLKQNKCTLFDLSVGPLTVNHIGPFIEQFAKPFGVPFREINWINQELDTIAFYDKHFIETTVNVAGEPVPSMHLVSFSHAFTALLLPEKLTPGSDNWIAYRSEISYRQAFTVVGTIGLAFFFALLLFNYLVFDHFDKKLTVNQMSFNHSQEQITRIEQLKKELQWRKQLAQKTGMTTKKHYAWFADQLATSIPAQISLTELTFHPVEKANNAKALLTFGTGYIDVKGKINISANLNQWIIDIRELTWVEQVEIRDLKQETSGQPALFSIRIKMKE